ncbi:MmpS family membrane protein [Mycobacterium tuberculosis]|nr:MmpS family membrane protein [Mycobacterium tuberculosis]
MTVSRLHSVFGSHQHAPDTGNLDPIIAFYPKHVLYEVFGPPGTVASINYLDADAQPHEVVNAAVPWSFTIVTTLTAVVANVVARGDGASLGCRITVNEVNRPGMSGDSSSWKGWGHVRWFIEEVPAGAA